MVLSILLALTVIIVMIDVLVGIHRGVKFGVVRLLIWIAGAAVAAVFARSLTLWILQKIAKVPDMKLFTFEVFKGWLGDYTDTIGNHLTGLSVSAFVPVVFVGLFLATKVVTWIIYLIVKQFIKKAAKRATAHNAAVDAVKAVRRSEMPDAGNPGLEQPFDHDAALINANSENGEDFGTFGIFPKASEVENNVEEVSDTVETVSETEAVVPVIEAAADGSIEGETETVPVMETETVAEQVSEETEEISDGFEAIAGSVDGFESLAMASMQETGKEEKRKSEKKAKPAKVKRQRPVKEIKLKERRSLALFLMKETTLSSVLGGFLGLFIALFACAIIAAPIKELVKVIAEEEMSEQAVDLAAALTKLDVPKLAKDAYIPEDKPMAAIPRDFNIIGDFSLRTDDFVEVCTDLDSSVLHCIYKYSGADATAAFIYSLLSPVKPSDIKIENRGIDSYNISDTIRAYAGLIPEFNALLKTLNERKGLTEELVDSLENCVMKILDANGPGTVLTESDKLSLANGILDSFNARIADSLGYGEESPLLERFEEYSQIKDAFAMDFDIVKRLIRAGALQ